MGKFVISKSKNGKFMFNLVASNGEVVCTSQRRRESRAETALADPSRLLDPHSVNSGLSSRHATTYPHLVPRASEIGPGCRRERSRRLRGFKNSVRGDLPGPLEGARVDDRMGAVSDGFETIFRHRSRDVVASNLPSLASMMMDTGFERADVLAIRAASSEGPRFVSGVLTGDVDPK
jgi:hypothetical protein